MEQLKNIEQCLISALQAQVNDLKKTDAKELGEVVDAIHHLEEAMYYCAITEAMKETKEKETPMNISYYSEPHYYTESNGGSQSRNNMNMGTSGNHNYTPYMEYAPYMMRDKQWREDKLNSPDRSYYSRKMYMETKQNNGDDQKAMKDLEHYIKDLGEEVTEMIQSATQEEKQVLATKLQTLAARMMK